MSKQNKQPQTDQTVMCNTETDKARTTFIASPKHQGNICSTLLYGLLWDSAPQCLRNHKVETYQTLYNALKDTVGGKFIILAPRKPPGSCDYVVTTNQEVKQNFEVDIVISAVPIDTKKTQYYVSREKSNLQIARNMFLHKNVWTEQQIYPGRVKSLSFAYISRSEPEQKQTSKLFWILNKMGWDDEDLRFITNRRVILINNTPFKIPRCVYDAITIHLDYTQTQLQDQDKAINSIELEFVQISKWLMHHVPLYINDQKTRPPLIQLKKFPFCELESFFYRFLELEQDIRTDIIHAMCLQRFQFKLFNSSKISMSLEQFKQHDKVSISNVHKVLRDLHGLQSIGPQPGSQETKIYNTQPNPEQPPIIRQHLVQAVDPTKPLKFETINEDKTDGVSDITFQMTFKDSKIKNLSVSELKTQIKQMPEEKPKNSQYVTLGPQVINGCSKLIGSTSSVKAVWSSIINRLAQEKIKPSKQYIVPVPDVKNDSGQQISIDNIVETWKGQEKYKRYKEAYETYKKNPKAILDEISSGKSIEREVFIKTEPLPKYIDGQYEQFSSRVISAPSKYEYALLQQVFFKNMSKTWKDYCLSLGCIYTSGMNHQQIGDRMAKEFLNNGVSYKYFYELDFSGFDSSQGESHFNAEQTIYNTVFKKFEEINLQQNLVNQYELQAIKKMVRDQKHAKLIFKSHSYPRFQIKQTYGRKSGDPNTSIGNTIINALTFYNIFKHDNNPKHSSISQAFMLGDDNLFASNTRYSEEDIMLKYREYGLNVKVQVLTNMYRAKFLQCFMIPVQKLVSNEDIECPQEIHEQQYATVPTLMLYRNPGRAMMQLQIAPKDFVGSQAVEYIDLQIESNKFFLELFPDLKYYFKRLREFYNQNRVRRLNFWWAIKRKCFSNEQKKELEQIKIKSEVYDSKGIVIDEHTIQTIESLYGERASENDIDIEFSRWVLDEKYQVNIPRWNHFIGTI